MNAMQARIDSLEKALEERLNKTHFKSIRSSTISFNRATSPSRSVSFSSYLDNKKEEVSIEDLKGEVKAESEVKSHAQAEGEHVEIELIPVTGEKL
jgi:hypothetical protein